MSLLRLSGSSRAVARHTVVFKRAYSVPVAPAAAHTEAAKPNEWTAKRTAVQAHAAHTVGMWKKIFYYFCIPGLIGAAYYTKQVEDEHAAHMEHEKHEKHGQPEPQYAYMNKRQKPFPWGMNTLFFNPEVNKDMSAAEDPEDIPESSKSKINRLQARIAELEQALREKEAELATCECRRSIIPTSPQLEPLPTPAQSQAATSTTTGMCASPTILDSNPQTQIRSASWGGNPIDSLETDGLDIEATIGLAEVNGSLPAPIYSPPASSTLSTTTWPPNIPPPELLQHLVETVFTCVPLAARLIHRPTFTVNLRKPPDSVDFPHVTILHAICALASLYTPIVSHVNPIDFKRGQAIAVMVCAGVVNRGHYDGRCGPVDVARKIDTPDVKANDFDFASAHLQWCRVSGRVALRRGDALLQQVQACILVAFFHHSRGEFIKAILWTGHAARLTASFGLNAASGFEPLSRIPATLLYILPPVQKRGELGRNIFWTIYALERILNASNVWPLLFEDDNCSQILPCRLKDFEAGVFVPTQGRQCLLSHGMLTTHPHLATDSFTLYIKASALLGKVKTFNSRFRYRYTYGDQQLAAPTAGGAENPRCSSHRNVAAIDPRSTDEFKALDEMCHAFVASIPRQFKDPVGLDTGAKLDPTLYMAHMLPHMAIITLHDPHASVFSRQDESAVKLLKAARSILDCVYKVCGTTFDMIQLDHASSTAWFIAGVTLIRFLSASTIQKEEEEIAKLTQELSAVRFILGNLGDRTGIGIRHIQLLEVVYRIEMGIPAGDRQPGSDVPVAYSAVINEAS
ncbi:hypothetical protein FRB96_005872 [Tulasnella sp. 330]|nr:hypothetical protein FRB96_005872 [Tulasnella sp. 330]